MTPSGPIAERILSDSPYERLCARQFSYLAQPIDRKLLWQNELLFSLAALLPVFAFLPASICTSYLPDAGHALIEYARLHLQPLEEWQERELLTLEGLCSMLGFGTGGFAIFVAHALVLVGFGGQEALTAFLEAGGDKPLRPVELRRDGRRMVAIAALVSAAALQFAGAYLHLHAVRLERT